MLYLEEGFVDTATQSWVKETTEKEATIQDDTPAVPAVQAVEKASGSSGPESPADKKRKGAAAAAGEDGKSAKRAKDDVDAMFAQARASKSKMITIEAEAANLMQQIPTQSSWSWANNDNMLKEIREAMSVCKSCVCVCV